MHALLDSGFGFHRHAQELDAIAKLGRGVEIGERDRRNALDVNRVRIDLGTERQARQDRKLLRGVVAFDVEGRIGLGVAQTLRFTQAFVEREPVLLHAREDVIAGAVEDAVDARERVAVEPLAQRLHDRYAAGDRGFEIERDAAAFRQHGKLMAMPGEQRLVGGHHRLAGRKCGFDRPLCGIALPADEFDQDIDRGIGGEQRGILDPAKFFQINVALLAAGAGADSDDLNRPPAARRELVTAALQADGRRPCRPFQVRQDRLSAARP